jgi:hypothetical protein
MASVFPIKPYLFDAIDEIEALLRLDTRVFGINADLQRLLTLNTVNSKNGADKPQSAPRPSSAESAKQEKTKKHGKFKHDKRAASATATAVPVPAVRNIGVGSCGVVVAGQEDRFVMKLSKTVDGSLWNDYRMQAVISEAMTRYCPAVNVPKSHYFVPQSQTRFFDEHPELVQAASDAVYMPTNVLVSERIRPLSGEIRTRLIEKYCPSYAKEAALDDVSNNDCLVRLYFGSKNSRSLSAGRYFSLCNFQLYLDQMLELDLDLEKLVERMAMALAVMHWAARTDAKGVEFVLGSKVSLLTRSADELLQMEVDTATGAESGRFEDMFWETTQFWVLDFDKVESITMDIHGVAQAVEAAATNDPYIPRPRQSTPEEKRVWNAFVQAYLDFSDSIITASGLGDKARELPLLFIEGLIRSEEQIRSY